MQAEPGRLTIGPDPKSDGQTLRVWGGQRVRVCKTKLRLGLLTADLASVEVVGDNLHIEAKSPSADVQD